jgi:hypothetical protein
MKTLITFTMMLVTAVTMAQDGNWSITATPKKANKIAVLLKDTSLVACRSKVVVQMTLNGYIVAKNDLNGFNVTSSPKQLNITEITVNAVGTKTDSGYFVVFTPKGEIKTKSEITSGPLEVNNSTIKGSLSQKAWDDLELLCESFNGKIFYYNRK